MAYKHFPSRSPACPHEKAEINFFPAGKGTTDFSFNLKNLNFFPVPVPLPAAKRMTGNPPLVLKSLFVVATSSVSVFTLFLSFYVSNNDICL